MTPDELRRATEIAEVEARVIARRLDELGRSAGSWAAKLGPQPPRSIDYPDDEQGRWQFAHDLVVGRLNWLQDRYFEIEGRKRRQAEAAAASAAGIERFLGEGRYDLATLTRPEAERQAADWDAAASRPMDERTRRVRAQDCEQEMAQRRLRADEILDRSPSS